MLSAREQHVVTRIGAGDSVSEIAAALGLSVKTVSTYRLRALWKLMNAGLIARRTTAQLMRYAIACTLVEDTHHG